MTSTLLVLGVLGCSSSAADGPGPKVDAGDSGAADSGSAAISTLPFEIEWGDAGLSFRAETPSEGWTVSLCGSDVEAGRGWMGEACIVPGADSTGSPVQHCHRTEAAGLELLFGGDPDDLQPGYTAIGSEWREATMITFFSPEWDTSSAAPSRTGRCHIRGYGACSEEFWLIGCEDQYGGF